MKILHETCIQYFQRRLAEGWKCVSLEGHNAILLSPEGFRRELDLRNDIETLRPNGGGTTTENRYKKVGEAEKAPDANENWKTVDEAVADDNDYVAAATIGAYTLDLYQLPHSGIAIGTINKVTVYNRWISAYTMSGYQGYAKTAIRTHGVNYLGSEHIQTHTTGAWEVISTEYALNPNTLAAWTWAEINAPLEAGVDLKREAMSLPQCPQVYVEVDYNFTPPPPPVTPEYQKRALVVGGIDVSAANPLPVTSEAAIDEGTATGGTNTTLVDNTKDWQLNIWEDAVIEVEIGGIQYTRTCVSNTADTITITALPVLIVVAAGDVYSIKRTVSPLSPIAKALVHNVAGYLAGADILGADVAPTNTPCLFRIMAGFTVSGILSVEITNGGNSQVQRFNGGVALNVNSLYAFSHLVYAGDTINYQYSVNTTIMTLRVVEIPSAI